MSAAPELPPDRIKLTHAGGGPLRIWKTPRPDRLYVLGGDPAGGKSVDDWSVVVVVDVATGEDVATWRGHVEPHELAEITWTLALYYRGSEREAMIVPETNNHGLAYLDALRGLGHTNFYSRRVWDRSTGSWQDTLGFCTSMKTRPLLINRARVALADPKVRINNPIILQEMATFFRDENGREEHQPGCYDDALFAWMLAQEGRSVRYSQEATESDGQDDEPEEPAQKVDPRAAKLERAEWAREDIERHAEPARYVTDLEPDLW